MMEALDCEWVTVLLDPHLKGLAWDAMLDGNDISADPFLSTQMLKPSTLTPGLLIVSCRSGGHGLWGLHVAGEVSHGKIG